MALADFHYTTGISSGFKVYILEGHSSFEHEQKFHRLPAHRLPVYSIKRKPSIDVRSPGRSSEGQKASKIQRSGCGSVAVPQVQRTSSVSIPVAVSCVSTSRPEPSRKSQALHPSCPHKCPLRKPLLDPALPASLLQQMRPSVITCAPRRNTPESPTSTSPTQISPIRHRNYMAPDSPYAERAQHLWATSAPELPEQLGKETSPEQLTKEASKKLQPSP